MRNASARENHPTRKRLDAAGSSEEKWGLFVVYRQLETVIFLSHLGCWLACVASVLERFRSKERRRRVKDRAKNGASKRSSPSFIFWWFLGVADTNDVIQKIEKTLNNTHTTTQKLTNNSFRNTKKHPIFWLLSILPTAKTENLVPRRSSVFLCSETTRKRLVRRLPAGIIHLL